MLDFLMRHMPSRNLIRGRYIEPFVGGGTVFFSIQPRKALLSDLNAELISLYLGLQQDAKGVWRAYAKFGNTKREYLRVRDEYSPRGTSQRAARILFLNRTCFKGMWRHNLNGEFNVGYGGQDRRWAISRDNLAEVQEATSHAKLKCSDFEAVIDQATKGDFIFADPPYRPGEKEQRHEHYAGKQFTFEDHIRLSRALHRATHRQVKWALTISSHPEILKLYRTANILKVPRGTGPNPGSSIVDSGEVLIMNYTRKGRGKRE